MKTLGEIVDAVMTLSQEEQHLLIQMLETRQNISTHTMPLKPQSPSTELFEDGRLTTSGVQGIMDELNATLDNPNLF
jgi:hypothetical protein